MHDIRKAFNGFCPNSNQSGLLLAHATNFDTSRDFHDRPRSEFYIVTQPLGVLF
jgi:hypothetical protein